MHHKKIANIYIRVFLLILVPAIEILEVLYLPKWQYYIAYFIGALIFISIQFQYDNKLRLKRMLIGLYTFILLIFVASLYVFPMDDIPDPSGTFQIGAYVETVEDTTRDEMYGDSSGFRAFTYQMWYPVDDVGDSEVMPWLSGGKDIARGLTKSIGLPSFILDHIQYTESNSYQIQTISDNQDAYPVVIISHGWGGFMNLHTDLAEALASRGYIVISIDHTYGSVATKLDSQTVYQDKDALPPRDETPDFLTYANQLVYTYAGDISFMLDYIETINSDDTSFLYNKLSLESIGLIGHSTGGGADVGVALEDDRIDALIGLDAWVEPMLMADIENGLTMPSLFLRSETWEEGENNTNLLALIEHSSDATLYQIDGTTHADFSMAYMFSPLMSMIGYTGSLDTDYLVDMQKSMINYFFDLHLKDDEDETFNFNHWEEVHEVSSS
jgi:pimeloyl-ACP methyl ester carboxylesterase